MKIAAIAANTAQLAIILFIFFIRGLDLGALVVFLLFVLMSVPCINFLALLFSNPSMQTTAPPNAETNGLVKRQAIRIRYGDDHCPVLKTANTSFAVRDLSEGGVRIRASQSVSFKKKIAGVISLLCGDQFHFKAGVMRREEGDVVLQFADPIGTAVLMQEQKKVATIKTG